MRKLLTAAALCGTIFSPLSATAAMADTLNASIVAADASADSLAAMEQRCSAIAASLDSDGPGAQSDQWSAEVVPAAASLVSGPTEVESSRVIDEESRTGTGLFVATSTAIRGNPFRIGGSVNLFGDQWSVGAFPSQTYNFTADFVSVYAHAFDCEIYRARYTPPVSTPVQGYYVNNGTNPSNQQGSCQGIGPSNPNWGEDLGNCTFVKTGEPVDTAGGLGEPELQGVQPGGDPINQSQTDTDLDAFEDDGGPLPAEYHNGQVVICISPSTAGTKGAPGSWRVQNGYNGGAMGATATGPGCNTNWFKNGAVWGSGTESSNGKYISVPGYILPNN